MALLLIVSSGEAQGQGPGRGRGMGQGAGGPALLRDSLSTAGPIQLLLARRDSLALDGRQVRQLQELDQALQQKNAPLVRSLLELRREVQSLIGLHPREMTEAQRAEFARQAERARPVMAQLQANNREAMARVGQLLSAAQKEQLRGWLRGNPMMGPGRDL